MKEPEVMAAEARLKFRNRSRAFWLIAWLGCSVVLAYQSATAPDMLSRVGWLADIPVAALSALFWHWIDTNVGRLVSAEAAEQLRLRLLTPDR